MDALNFSPMENQPQFLQTAARDIIAGRVQVGIQRIVDKKLNTELHDNAFLYVCRFLLINAKFDHVNDVANKISDYSTRMIMMARIKFIQLSNSMTISHGHEIDSFSIPYHERIPFERLNAPD